MNKIQRENKHLTLEEIIQLLQPRQWRIWLGVKQKRAPTLNADQCQSIIASLIEKQMVLQEIAKKHKQQQQLSRNQINIDKELRIEQGQKQNPHEKEKQQIIRKVVNLHHRIFGEKTYQGQEVSIGNVDELMKNITRSFDSNLSKIKDSKAKVKDFKTEVFNLKNQLQKMKDEWEQKMKEVPKSIEETQKALSKLSDQNELQRKTISSLETNSSNYNLQIQALNKEKNSLMTDRDRYRATIKTLKAKLNPDDAEKFKNDLMIMPQEAKELQEKLSDAEEKCLQLEDQIKSLKIQIESVKGHDQTQTLAQKNEESIKVFEEKEHKIDELKMQIKRLTEIIKQNTEMKDEYKQKINELEFKLQNKSVNLTEGHHNTVTQEDTNKKQTRDINKNQSNSLDYFPSSDVEIKWAQNSKEVESNQLKTQSNKSQNFEQKEIINSEQLQDTMNQKQENVSGQESAEPESKEQVEQEIYKLRKQRQIITLEIRQKEGKLASITASKIQLEKEIITRRQTLKDIDKEVQMEKFKSEQQMKKVRGLIEELQEEHSQLDKIIKTSRKDRETIEQELNRKKEELKAIKESLKKIKSEIAENESHNNKITPGQLQAILDQNLQVNKGMVEEKATIQSAMNHLNNNIVKKAKIEREQQTNKQKSNTSQPNSELSKIESERSQLQQKIIDMYEAYEKQVQQTTELLKSIYQAKAQLAQLQIKRINGQKDNQIRSLRQQLRSQAEGKTGDSLQN